MRTFPAVYADSEAQMKNPIASAGTTNENERNFSAPKKELRRSYEKILASRQTSPTPKQTGKAKMSDVSRDELDAKLGQNKAEINAIISGMQREMAEFRAFQTQQFSALSSSLSEIKGEIVAAKGEAAGQKEGLAGQIDGVKSSISTMQWMIGTVLAMIGIVAAVLAIPGVDKIFK
ncbi:hypothetical protein [Enterobacter hormaechei]|uniref:hypothetical protein n=1 Tax=Enterobacter hormaechei TaxID=158836 RepID=UPI00254AEBFE|nr:hypothetical protein [Enterobacter hormaechei]MDK9957316.1 hypothetical protein [Enterobacter hormaechei]